MKAYRFLQLIIFTMTLTLAACSTLPPPPTPAPVTPPTSIPEAITPGPADQTTPEQEPDLPLNADWQVQYTGELDLSLDVDVFNLDLFEASPEDIASLHTREIFVMCYFSAGSWEDWRPDADSFPKEIIGKGYEGWPGEKWLDVRDIPALEPVIASRLSLAVEKACDGVDPDNVNGYENDTGFPITYADQLEFNIWLAQTAHARGLDIGLKNDLNQINDLVPYFDWVLNEECFSYDECELLSPFYAAGKPVFVIEYETAPSDFCPQTRELGFNAIYKNWELDAYREACP